ncbi:MAG: hypothetical protein WD990_06535 [Acidimicrobiia bacterium]
MDDRNPTSDRLRRLASRYEAGVGRGRAEQIAARAITRAHRRSSVGRRLAVAVSTGAFMLVSMTGVGVAADRAVPGDFLYSLDRALEALGFSSDLVEERLLEAITLADRGDMALAIKTANEALEELGRSGVTATLPTSTQDLAAPTTESGNEPSTTTTESEIVETTTLPESTGTEPPDEPQETVDDAPETTIEAAAEPADAVATLRLAAEQLLQSVRSAKSDPTTTGDVTIAARFLAETTAGASGNEESVETTSTTSSTTSSTTTSTSTTSTTVPEELTADSGNDQDSGTTTTTVASDPNDGSGSDDSTGDGEDDSPGPIFLPTP